MTEEFNTANADTPDVADPFLDDAGVDSWDDAMKAAPAPENFTYDDLPNGKYTVFTFSAKPLTIGKGRREGYRGFGWKMCVMSGPERGFLQNVSRFFHVKDEPSLTWLKKDLVGMGIDPDAPTFSLKRLMGEGIVDFLDRVLEIEVKRAPNTNNPDAPYVNVYINKWLPGVPVPEELREIAKAGGTKRAQSSAQAGVGGAVAGGVPGGAAGAGGVPNGMF